MYYQWIIVRNHPMTNKWGKILKHRYLMSQLLGRPLKKSECVHHKDGNHLNNDIKNLQLITRQEHPKIHLTGKPLPKWHCEKLSKAHLGQKAWNKGKKLAPEHIKKLSDVHKGKIPWNKGKKGICFNTGKTHFKKGHKSGMTGKHHSEETKKKLSENHIGQIAWNKGLKFSHTNSEVS